MTRFTITAPVRGFSGARAGVMFGGGRAEVDDGNPTHAKALRYFERKGYGIEEIAEVSAPVPARDPAEVRPPADDGAEDDGEPADDSTAEGDTPAERPRPRGNASQADWAVYVGVKYGSEVTPEQVAEMTRAELQKFDRDREGAGAEADDAEDSAAEDADDAAAEE